MAVGCVLSILFWATFAFWFVAMLMGAAVAPLLAFLLAIALVGALLLRALRSDWPLI